VSAHLTYDLHVLTARLDRAADRALQEEQNISYARFLALVAIADGAGSQRELADWLGVTEPSASRMTGVLTGAGLITAGPDPRGGNRRLLRLTAAGRASFQRGVDLLERRFADIVDRCGIPYGQYAAHTRLLIAALDDETERPHAREGGRRQELGAAVSTGAEA
jgi:DNA-binding MarR family transcriptional regulator